MKPLHVGLLVAGAAVAGALAVKMTQPPALPAPVNHPTARVPQPDPIPQKVSQSPARSATVIPAVASVYASQAAEPDVDTSAPPPVYSEPRHKKPAPFKAPDKPPEPEQKVAELTHAPVPYHQPETPAAPTPNQTAQLIEQVEEPHAPRQVTLEPGMIVSIRLMETLSSDRASAGDAFSASLAEPLIIDRLIVAERGARVDGQVVAVARPSRIGGRSELQLQISKITTADGQRIAVSTDPWTKTVANSGTRVAEKIGGGAALGAIIGAVAGGGAGAAIGAGIGTGAGLGTAMATRPKPVTLATETVIVFRVNSRVKITERQL